jgi:D-alanyl-D-alanine carboxypeptidase (penicillin-binding protein 5/6)
MLTRPIYLIFSISYLFFASALQAAALPIPKAPATGAKSYIIQDFNSGRVIAAENADQSVEPASITKLMTAYVVFNELASGNISLNDMVTISEKAWRTPGSRMFVEVGKQVSVEDLLQGMIVQSGNDATVALAEFIAGSEDTFAALMNRHAEDLGLNGSHFMNSTGLPGSEHYMTAQDIATLSTLLIAESSALKDGMRLITVVLGTNSMNARVDSSQALLNYGFRFFETHKLYDAGTRLSSSRIWKGTTDNAALGLNKALYVTIPRGQYPSLDASMSINNRIIAPVNEGQSLGKVQVKLGDAIVAEQDLVSLQSVGVGSFWQRITDEALLYFE